MTPAIIFGFGQLGAALAGAIAASGRFSLAAVIDSDPAAAARVEAVTKAPFSTTLADCALPAPATLFHATTSSPEAVVDQTLAALDRGFTVISAAEWLFHPWLRFRQQGDALHAAARRRGVHVMGCGINPGFTFETLPLVLARTVHDVRSIEVLRVSDVGGIGPSDFAHLGFGLDQHRFVTQVATGLIAGHMGFPESVAALAERLPLHIDRITDELVPTLAHQTLALPYTTIQPGEVVGITQVAVGSADGEPRIRFTLDMFLDPGAYGRVPLERIGITANRSFQVDLQPAAPPSDGAAAIMVQAAASLSGQPPGLVSLLDLPLGGAERATRLRADATTLSETGTDMSVRPEPTSCQTKD